MHIHVTEYRALHHVGAFQDNNTFLMQQNWQISNEADKVFTIMFSLYTVLYVVYFVGPN